jgi:peptidoglycan/LPS O-acetylase OafA/YrhL
LIVTLTISFGVVAEVLSYLDRYAWLPYYLRTGTYVYSPTIVPFNIGAILCVYLLGVHLVSPKRSERTRAAVRSGSDNSYGVYLSQMLWIPFLLRVRNHFHLHLAWGVAVPLALVLVYSLGFLFTAIVARTPLSLALTGRSRATWDSFLPRRREPSEERRGDAGDGPLEVVYE